VEDDVTDRPFETVMMLRDGKTTFNDWIRARRAGLGGTDAAALSGHNPYKSITTLFCDKVAGDQPVEASSDSEPAYFGRLLEPVVAEEFKTRTGLCPEPADCLLRSTTHPFMLATLDFWVLDPSMPGQHEDQLLWEADSFLECKTTAWYRGRFWKAGSMPPYVEAQVLHYLAVTGFSHAWVACLIGGQSFVYLRYDRDEAAIKRLVELERRFWEYVEARELPPDPFVTADTEPLGRHTFRTGETTSMLVLPDGARELVDVYWSLRESEEQASAARKMVEDELGHMLYGAHVGIHESDTLLRWEGARGSRRLVIARPGTTDEQRVTFS
jgi:putative phage-type endonuclease